MRQTGIDIIGNVPWGTHFCQFYQDKQDLVDLLVPYFKAGLEKNEFCMWITSEPLGVEEAKEALGKEVENLDVYLRRGQIEILDYRQWYTLGGQFESDRVLRGWVEKLDDARQRGFDGLRLTGNTFWLEKSDWQDFTEYEAAVDNVLGQYQMLAMCTYSLAKCGAIEIMDVVSNHEFALIKRGNTWQVIESAERKKIEADLRASEARYHSLFNGMTEGFALHEIICDKQGTPCDYRFLDINPAFERLTGLKREDVVGKTVREALPGTEQTWIDTYGKVAQTGEAIRFDNYAAALAKHFEVYAYCPAPNQFAVIFIDITARKQSQAIMARYQLISQHARDPLLLMDLDGNIIEGNRAAEELYGYTHDELLHLHIQDLRRLENPELMSRQMQQARTRGVLFEAVHQRKDGATVPVEVSSRGVSVEGQEMLLSVVRDITERARADAALRESEQRWATTLASIGDAVIATDIDGRITFLNPVAASLTGWTVAEAHGQPIACVFHIINELTHEPAENLVARVIREKHVIELANHTALVTRDGREVPIEDSAAPITDAAGNVTGVVIVFHDVTEKRRAQDALRESEANVRAILDAAKESIYLFDAQGIIVVVNATAAARLGHPVAAVVGHHFSEFVPPELATSRWALLRQVLTSGQPIRFEDERNGIIFDHHAFPVFAGDQVIRIAVFSRDITERTKRETELRKLNRTLNALRNSSQAMMRATDESSYLDEVCGIVVEDCGHSMVWVGYAEEDAGKTIRPVAYAGFEEGYLETLQLTWADTERGRGPTGTAIRTSSVSMCRNMLTDPQFTPWRQQAIQRGYASSIVLPLMADGRAFGALTIYATAPDPFTADEVQLLSELADDLAYGIMAIRLRNARAQAEEALRVSERRVRLKLDSILLPEGDLGNLELADIIDVPAIQILMNNFYQLTHIPMCIIDIEGNIVVGAGWQDVCTRFHRVHPETCAHCIESDTQLTLGVAPGEFKLYKCKNHMWDVATPLIMGSQHVGNLFSGQFCIEGETLDDELFRTQARKYGFAEDEYLAALAAVPRLSRETVDTGMVYLAKLAHLLSQLSYSNIALARSLAQRDVLEEALRLSEQRWATTLASIGDAVIATDVEGSITFMNAVAEELSGWTLREVAGKPVKMVFNIINEGTRRVVEDPVSKVLETGKIVGLANHTLLVRKDGLEVPIDDSGAPIRDQSGEITGVVLVFRDITARKQAEQALTREHAFLEAAIEVLPQPLAFFDAQQEIIRENSATRILEQRIGLDSRAGMQFLHPQTYSMVPEHDRPAARALQGEIVIAEEYLLTAPGGEERMPALVSAAPIRIDGEIAAVVSVIEDITVLKDADHAKDEFLAVLSHELQTPLTNMLGWSTSALEKQTPAFTARAMEVVHRNAQRQKYLVDEILDMSRLIHRKIHLTLEATDFGTQAQQAVESMQPNAAQRGLTLTLATLTAPLPIQADSLRLQQCIGNLVQNSLKFTPADGVITVYCRREGEEAVLSIRDTGRGIAPEMLPSLFTLFKQVDRNERNGGLGLGLAVVRGIIELHGGRVWAESPGVGQGSTFSIALPLAKVALLHGGE